MFSPGDLTAQSLAGVTLEGFESHKEFETDCAHCHAPLETIQADLCVRCHTSIIEQINSQHGTHSMLENIQRCWECHPDHNGRDFNPTTASFSLYDHSLTSFSILWHQVDYDTTPMNCFDCHSHENGFILNPSSCEGCHVGNDQVFMEEHIQDFRQNCLACHDGSGEMVNFDHSTTQFSLDGMHAQVQCADCHTEGNFLGLSLDCADCHIEPDIHNGLFSQVCASCHTPTDWAALVGLGGDPYDHFEQTGFSLTRHLTDYSDTPIQCTDCHTSEDGFKVSFHLNFCVECHNADYSNFIEEHQIQFGLECLSCHDGVDRMHDFDHNRFFILDGQHTNPTCETCHIDQVFNGTPSDCVDCHEEPEIHIGYFGLQCENCHSTTAWAPAKMVKHFFPLDHGEDSLIACEVCHATRYTEYTCYGCHGHQEGDIIEEHLEEGISQLELVDCAACHPDGLENVN